MCNRPELHLFHRYIVTTRVFTQECSVFRDGGNIANVYIFDQAILPETIGQTELHLFCRYIAATRVFTQECSVFKDGGNITNSVALVCERANHIDRATVSWQS
jgi:hypothetical protein